MLIKMITILLLLCSVIAIQSIMKNDDPCPGNRFLFLSTFALGKQGDLTNTTKNISETAVIARVEYQDELYRRYTIENITQTMTYQQIKQNATLMGKNILRITGGTIRVNFKFDWQKVQLGNSLKGTGSGTVSTDPITFQKTLLTNSSHQLQWNLTFSESISITNGLSLSTVTPYRAADYQILSNMLNKLKTNQTTVKDNLLKVLNERYQKTLRWFVSQDQTLRFDSQIYYSYADYRDLFQVRYSQTLMNSTLAKDGLYLIFSQKIIGDDDFECGPPVPQVPSDTSIFGGLQEFLSNSLLKSTLKWGLKKGFLDVILTQQFWQSRAFQFFIGDVHDVMPTSTKNISTMQELKGKCKGLDDPVFNFAYKSATAYEIKVNFECDLNLTTKNNTTKLITINIVVSYQVAPKLNSKSLDFVLSSLGGKPTFVQINNYKVQYPQLAEFMVSETMALAKGGKVIGSGYKMDRAVYRKFPNVWVKQDYLFLYDSSNKPKKDEN